LSLSADCHYPSPERRKQLLEQEEKRDKFFEWLSNFAKEHDFHTEGTDLVMTIPDVDIPASFKGEE
jgi:hypothetical protein